MPNQNDIDSLPHASSSSLTQSVPTIDILSALKSAKSYGPNEIAAAAREWGFFQVVNHRIPTYLCERIIQQAKLFFDQSLDRKIEIQRSNENPWGYHSSELTKNKLDFKEVFDAAMDGGDDVFCVENQWPTTGNGFRRTMQKYAACCLRVGADLLEALALGLDLPADALARYFRPASTSFLRLNNYPVKHPLLGEAKNTPGGDAVYGVHHHTDAGALTLLLQHKQSGLQVLKDQVWHDVPPIDGAIVVNIGDMMQVLSNDTYRAPIHRVTAIRESRRISVPFFLNPASDALIRPLDNTISGDRPMAYRAFSWEEYRRRRALGDYADVGSEVQLADYRI